MATAEGYDFTIERKGIPAVRGRILVAQGRGAQGAAGQSLPTVVLAHGPGASKEWGFIPYLAQKLASEGYSALTFDFTDLGVGNSGSRLTNRSFGEAGILDMVTVFDAIGSGELPSAERLNPSKCALVGYSYGAAIGLLFASDFAYTAKRAKVSALCTIGCPSGFELFSQGLEKPPLFSDASSEAPEQLLLTASGRLLIPWLLAHGEEDELVPLRNAELLHSRADQRLCRFEAIAGASHSLDTTHPLRSSPSPSLLRFETHLLSFLRAHLMR